MMTHDEALAIEQAFNRTSMNARAGIVTEQESVELERDLATLHALLPQPGQDVEWGTATPGETNPRFVSPHTSEESADYHVLVMGKLGDMGGKRVTMHRTVGPWMEKKS